MYGDGGVLTITSTELPFRLPADYQPPEEKSVPQTPAESQEAHNPSVDCTDVSSDWECVHVEKGLMGNAIFSTPLTVAIHQKTEQENLSRPKDEPPVSFQYFIDEFEKVLKEQGKEINDLYREISQGLWASSEEKTIRKGLIEASRIVFDLAENMEWLDQQLREGKKTEGEVQAEQLKLKKKLKERIAALNEKIDNCTTAKSSFASVWDRRLNHFTFILNAGCQLCKVPEIGNLITVILTGIRTAIQEYSDAKKEKAEGVSEEKSKEVPIGEVIKSIISPVNDFLEEKIDMSGMPTSGPINALSQNVTSLITASEHSNQKIDVLVSQQAEANKQQKELSADIKALVATAQKLLPRNASSDSLSSANDSGVEVNGAMSNAHGMLRADLMKEFKTILKQCTSDLVKGLEKDKLNEKIDDDDDEIFLEKDQVIDIFTWLTDKKISKDQKILNILSNELLKQKFGLLKPQRDSILWRLTENGILKYWELLPQLKAQYKLDGYKEKADSKINERIMHIIDPSSKQSFFA